MYRFIGLLTIAFFVFTTQTVLASSTYTGNKLLTKIVESPDKLQWTTASIFKKNINVKGNTILGSDTADTIKLKGTVSNGNDSTPIQIHDDVHITGTLTLDTALYTAGTGIAISNGQISSTLGTSITASEIAANAVTSTQLASDAIVAGDIQTADLPSISTANLTDSASIALLNQTETITANWVNTANPWADNEVANNLTVSGGAIDDTAIGATTASTGSFTTVAVESEQAVFSRLHSIPRANVTTDFETYVDGSPEYANVVIGVDGYPVVAFKDYDSSVLKLFHCTATDCSTADAIRTFSGINPTHISLAIGTDGFPIIAYRSDTEGTAELIHCTTEDCSQSDDPISLDSSTTVDNFVKMKIGVDGFPIIIFGHNSTTLRLVHCTALDCSSKEDAEDIVDTNAASSGAIVIGVDGLPVVFYKDTDPASNDLKAKHCTLANCSSSDSAVTLDNSVSNVGSQVVATVGVDGMPIAAYYDSSATNLKFVHCTSITCSSNDTPLTVDNSIGVGVSNAITIGPDGLPVITYVGGAQYMLKCGSINCGANGANAIITIDSEGQNAENALAFGIDNLPIIVYGAQPDDYTLRVKHGANAFFTNYATY